MNSMKLDYDITTEEMELIEKHLENELTPDQALLFDEKSKNDPDWPKKIEEMRLLMLGVQESSLRSLFSEYYKKEQPAQTSTRMKSIPAAKRWLIAASVFIVFSVAAWLLIFRNDEDRSLYAKYYKPDPGLLTAMGPASNYLFEKGMVEYKNEEYEKALSTWAGFARTATAGDTLHFFMAMANQALGRLDSAKTLLAGITSESGRPFYQEACWYYGLILLKEGQKSEASYYIEKSEHPGKAELLKEIKSN